MGQEADRGARLVWVDLEMTGLDPGREVAVEIASVITEGDLELVAEGPDLVIAAPEERLAAMVPVVRKMHEQSGLLEAIRASTLTVEEAEEATLVFVREHCPAARVHPLCGNTIGTDRQFLERYMPRLAAHLHYRSVDVSGIKELAKRWYPDEFAHRPAKAEGHRALIDIRESIEELRYWRRAVFRAPAE